MIPVDAGVLNKGEKYSVDSHRAALKRVLGLTRMQPMNEYLYLWI